MMTHDLTNLERSVLGKLLEGEHLVLEALRGQLVGCRAKSRELTGHGFFTELQVDRKLPAAPMNTRELRIADVNAKMADLKHGAGFVLFVNAGYLDMLEGHSYDEPWPETIGEFELSYAREPRDCVRYSFDS